MWPASSLIRSARLPRNDHDDSRVRVEHASIRVCFSRTLQASVRKWFLAAAISLRTEIQQGKSCRRVCAVRVRVSSESLSCAKSCRRRSPSFDRWRGPGVRSALWTWSACRPLRSWVCEPVYTASSNALLHMHSGDCDASVADPEDVDK